MGCSPWGCTESDTTEPLTHTHTHTHTHSLSFCKCWCVTYANVFTFISKSTKYCKQSKKSRFVLRLDFFFCISK